jgi:2,3-bisphosphoglycerate-independent phosphoglycerate mutase
MFTGLGVIKEIDPLIYLEQQYQNNITDEFVEPLLFNETYKMSNDDSVFFINFRPDRAIQISLAMNDPEFNQFERAWTPHFFLCMTPYVPDELTLPILFDKEKIEGCFSEYLSKLGLHQFKIAETEKYAHITFFFNGGRKEPFENETQTLIPSPKEVATYDQKPEMSAPQVTEKLLAALDDEKYSFYLVNYANSDMVGHTGNYDAAVKAIETLDHTVGELAKKCLDNDIALVITADHGNSDRMVYENGEPHTSHTNAPVPFSIIHPKLEGQKLELNLSDEERALKDVIPTLVYMMDLPKSNSFTGKQIFN